MHSTLPLPGPLIAAVEFSGSTSTALLYMGSPRIWPGIHVVGLAGAAQEWNEMHHLQIMESLGGDSLWLDRFMAQHGALVYYWVLIGTQLAQWLSVRHL